MPRESYDQARILAALHSRGAYAVKFHSNALTGSGTPDILCCYRGLFLAFEVKNRKFKKNPWSKLSLDQVSHAQAIQKSLGQFHCITSPKEALEILDELDAIFEGK